MLNLKVKHLGWGLEPRWVCLLLSCWVCLFACLFFFFSVNIILYELTSVNLGIPWLI